jgi:hypothetical protein
MAEHIIPKNAGPYRVFQSYAGTPLVANDRTGKTKVRIACRTWEQAEEICRRLNKHEHNGVIRA